MAFQPSADSFGFRRLGVKCSWWHPMQANDAVAFKPSIFNEMNEHKLDVSVECVLLPLD